MSMCDISPKRLNTYFTVHKAEAGERTHSINDVAVSITIDQVKGMHGNRIVMLELFLKQVYAIEYVDLDKWAPLRKCEQETKHC